MVRLKIDGIPVQADEGALLLDAAALAGVEIPTLCYEKKAGALTSCMICVVRDRTSGRTLPACSAKAVEGMDIDTRGESVRAARREILLMLLSEHVGDCEAPCTRICPAGLNIPRMLRYIANGETDAAARLAKRDLVFPGTLGWICSAPCERGCRRAQYDTPLAIRGSHRALPQGAIPLPPPSDKRVAVVGAGLAGLAAAWTCRQHGHACHVFEMRDTACAALYALPPEQLPRETLDAEIASIRDAGTTFDLSCEVGSHVAMDALVSEFDAVILACDLSANHAKIVVAREDTMPVRAVAEGKAAAARAHALMDGVVSDAKAKRFNSQVGMLSAGDLPVYAVERVRQTEGESAQVEAARCLHCDCLKPVSCKLRQYADEYGITGPIRRHMPRPSIESIRVAGEVLFEAGKCIKCGICVELTRKSGGVGVTLAGRGLASHLDVPLSESWERVFASSEIALECVRACPTGALAWRGDEETA